MQTLKRIIFVVALTGPFSIHADSESIFNSALEKLKGFGSSNCWLCASTRNPEEPSLREKCVAQLCPIRTESDETVTAEARKAFDKDPEVDKVRKLVLNTLILQMEKKRANDQYLLNALSRNVEFSTPGTRLLARLVKSSDKIFEFLKVDASGEFDAEGTRKALIASKRSEDEVNFLVLYADRFLKQFSDPNEKYSDFEELRKTLSETEFKRRLSSGHKDLLDAVDQLAAKTGLPKDAIYNSDTIRENLRHIEAGTISEGRFDDIKSSYISLRFRLGMLAEPGKWAKDNGKRIGLRDLMPPNIEERLKSRIEVADKILAKDYSESQHPYRLAMDRVFGKCLSALREGYAMSPDENQLAEFKKVELAYRREFAVKMKRFMSAKSASELAKAIEKWDIKYPPVRSEFMAKFHERISSEAEIQSVGELARNVYGLPAEFAALELAGDGDLRNDDEYFETMNSVCTSEVPQAFGDQSRLSQDRVGVSSRTVTRPDYAKQILFHEYGHLLSKMIFKEKRMSKETKDWRNNFLTCLEKQRGSKKAFNEEDFVQSLALALAAGSADFNCHKDLPWTDDKYFNLADDESDKEHSGVMYNLVLGIFARGTDFSDCRKAFLEAGEKEIPESCFAQTTPASTAK